MSQILTLSNGTTTVDFLNPTGPYYLASYETGMNQWKNGGLYAGNDLSESSYPIYRQFDSFEEKIGIHITGSSQNDVLANLRTLITLLEGGMNHFINNRGSQVYLTRKADFETNESYAVVVGYTIDGLPNLFDGTFITGGYTNVKITNVYQDIQIIIKRGMWLENIPGTLERVYLDSQTSFNGWNIGLASSNTEPIFLSNYSRESNITYAYVFDASSGVWSSNLMNVILNPLPQTLLPATPAVNDALYIGVGSAITDASDFENVIFNLSVAGSGLTIVKEVYISGTWDTVPVINGYDWNFTGTGPRMVSWTNNNGSTVNLLSNLGGSAPNLTGYWMRFRVTAVSTPVAPVQTTRLLYSASQPYADVQITNLSGDVEPILRMEVKQQSYTPSDKLLIARRLHSRGSNFVPYLNFSDEQRPSGITFEVSGSWTFQTDSDAPTNRVLRQAITNTTFGTTYAFFEIDDTIAPHFYGKYRCFLRVKGGSTPGDVLVRLSIRPGAENSAYQSNSFIYYPEVEKNADGTSTIEVLDFGIVDILSSLQAGVGVGTFRIGVELLVQSGSSTTISLIDMVLMPADECIMEIDANWIAETTFGQALDVHESDTLIIDKLTKPEEPTDIYTLNSDGDRVLFPTSGGSETLLGATTRFFYCFFTYERETTLSGILYNTCYKGKTFEVDLYKMNRYLVPRGTT